MSYGHGRRGFSRDDEPVQTKSSPGKVQMRGRRTPVQQRYGMGPRPAQPVQARGTSEDKARGSEHAESIRSQAAAGVAGSGGALPHLDMIQAAFGQHDVTNVQAHIGGAAADASAAIGAEAYATGNDVAFRDAPDLHTAAHEAAHVVQQRSGVQLKGGVGEVGDAYEQHADAVADAVVQGRSAEALLDRHAGGSRNDGALQRKAAVVQMDGEDAADAQPAAEAERDYTTDIQTEMRLAVAASAAMFTRQVRACETLLRTAGQEDPPPFWQQLALLGVQLAIVGATGGVGAIVSASVARAATNRGVREAVANIIASMASDAAKAATGRVTDAAGAALSRATSMYPEGDPERAAKIFFEAQIHAIDDAKYGAETTYIRRERELQGEDGLLAAQALRETLEANHAEAYSTQRSKSIQEWANYQARGTRGTTDDDGDTVNMAGRGSRGVLRLRGTWFDGERLVINRATMAGMNSAVRPDIADTAIRDLNVPIDVTLQVGGELGWVARNLGRQTQPEVSFSRDNNGGVWCNEQQTTGLYFLARATRTPTQEYAGRRWYTTAANPFATVRATFDAMASMKPPLR